MNFWWCLHSAAILYCLYAYAISNMKKTFHLFYFTFLCVMYFMSFSFFAVVCFRLVFAEWKDLKITVKNLNFTVISLLTRTSFECLRQTERI